MSVAAFVTVFAVATPVSAVFGLSDFELFVELTDLEFIIELTSSRGGFSRCSSVGGGSSGFLVAVAAFVTVFAVTTPVSSMFGFSDFELLVELADLEFVVELTSSRGSLSRCSSIRGGSCSFVAVAASATMFTVTTPVSAVFGLPNLEFFVELPNLELIFKFTSNGGGFGGGSSSVWGGLSNLLLVAVAALVTVFAVTTTVMAMFGLTDFEIIELSAIDKINQSASEKFGRYVRLEIG